MAVAFRAESHVINSTGTTGNPGEPSGTASGDALIMFAIVDATSATFTLPAGWTSLVSGTVTSKFKYDILWIERGGSAVATTVTVSSGAYKEIYILGISGADTTTPIDATAAAVASGTGSRGTAVDPPAVTAVSSAALAVAFGVHWAGSLSGWTAPTGYTLQTDNTAGNDGMAATKLLSASGSENPSNFVSGGAGTSDAWIAYTLTIAPPGAGGGGTTVKALAALGVG
jgi:hypothetical protein